MSETGETPAGKPDESVSSNVAPDSEQLVGEKTGDGASGAEEGTQSSASDGDATDGQVTGSHFTDSSKAPAVNDEASGDSYVPKHMAPADATDADVTGTEAEDAGADVDVEEADADAVAEDDQAKESEALEKSKPASNGIVTNVVGWYTDSSTGIKQYYDQKGVLHTGWLVVDWENKGLQRFWFDTDGTLAVARLISDKEAGYWAYATDRGPVVRGKYRASDGRVYLADNDGRLASPGWHVTAAYGDGLQRYWVDAKDHAAKPGYSEDGYAHYTTSAGYVLRGATTAGGAMRWADNDGRLKKDGWLVTRDFGGGIQRFWFRGGQAVRSALLPASEAGYWAYARPDGRIVRGKYRASDGRVYLADNDGRLASPGWHVTAAYGDGLQRYWVDAKDHAAKPGYSEDGYAHYTTSAGYVLRGSTAYGNGVLLADNDGLLVGAVVKQPGWFVTAAYSGNGLQRYWIDYISGKILGAKTGLFKVSTSEYYGLPNVGYVLRNDCRELNGIWRKGDNDGKLSVVRNTAIRRGATYIWVDGNGRTNQQEGINRLMSAARSVLGVPYVWLGKYPQDGGMDCASFTWWCYRQLGITIDFETYGQIHDGAAVSSLSQARPGDLILMYFSSPGVPEHVVMYAGNGMIYEEPNFGGHCQYVPLSSKGTWSFSIRRILA